MKEIDKSGSVDAEMGPEMEMGDDTLDVTDEMEEQSSSKRAEAGDALNEGASALPSAPRFSRCYYSSLQVSCSRTYQSTIGDDL